MSNEKPKEGKVSDEKMVDVVAIKIKGGEVLWVDGPKTERNADATINIAIMRQGVEDRFFSAANPGQYKSGDKWNGGVDIEVTAPRGNRGLDR
jgi:hypothetical protein